MAITDESTFYAALAGAATLCISKASLSNAAAGVLMSLWRATGIPLQGAIPGTTWAACTNATTGSLAVPTRSGQLYLMGLEAQMATAGSLLAYVRKGANGGLSGTSTSAQTVNSGNAADASDGWFLEWYTDTGSTAVTATITYTNQSDVTGRTTTVALAATRRAGVMLPILPNSSDAYIKSIQSVTLSATTGSAGSFGVTLACYLACAPVAITNQVTIMDPINVKVRTIAAGACIMLAVLPSTTSTGFIQGCVDIGDA